MQTLEDFQILHKYEKTPELTFIQKAKAAIPGISVSQTFLSIFPFLGWMRQYKFKEYIVDDVVIGCTIGIMHIPQGLAAAILAGVPPVVGLYMASFPSIIYALMSTSKHISIGTIAIICIMVKPIVSLHAKPETVDSNFEKPPDLTWSEAIFKPENAELTSVQVATAVCFAVGVWQLLMGVFRLGIVSVILSDALVSGFSTAGATHIFSSQLGNLLGIEIAKHSSNFKVLLIFRDAVLNILTMNLVSFALSMSVMAVLITYSEVLKPRLEKVFRFPIPVEMFCIIICTLLSMAFDLENKYGVKCFGTIPRGVPAPSLPAFWFVPQIALQSLPIAIVGYAITISVATILAKKSKYEIRPNQEFLAYGCCNIFASFFSCIPVAGSISRSIVQHKVGGKTQIVSFVSCAFVLLVLVAIGPFFEPLPSCVLAAILIVTLKGIMWQVKDFPGIYRRSKSDGIVWMGTFFVAICWDTDYGLAAGLILSTFSVILHGQKLNICVLGRVPRIDTYLDKRYYSAAEEIPGVKIIYISGSLHFASKGQMVKKCTEIVNIRNQQLGVVKNDVEHEFTKDVIIDLSGVYFIDPSATDALKSLREDIQHFLNGSLYLANCPPMIQESLIRYKFFGPDCHINDCAFPTINDAVLFIQSSAAVRSDSQTNKVNILY
ncbi:prestin-like [Cloeon dipterum]|uniref:prestin-like n=1 Tax=Cloeon dipterum TaxID=197152 RepID=UPI00321FA31B